MTGANTVDGFTGLALYEMMRLIRGKVAADKSFLFPVPTELHCFRPPYLI